MASNPFSSVPPLFADLAKSLAGDLECAQDKLTVYSNDGSLYTVRPQAVVFPKQATDIKHVLSFAREYHIPVTVWGKGASRSGGALGEGIILDMSRYFTHVRQINMLDQTITVDAGVTIKSLREKLHAWKVDIPVLTAQDNDSTLGAFIATKSATPTSFSSGTIREWIEGLTVVVDTGEEHKIADGITPSGRLLGIYQSLFPVLTENASMIRAQKPALHDDATGYSIWNTSIGPRQLLDELVGSEGTLGIITSVTLRLVPHNHHTLTVCIPFSETKLLSSYIEIAKHHHANHMFLYDGTFMELVDRYHYNVIPSYPNARFALTISFFGQDKEHLHRMVKTFTRALPELPEETQVIEDKYCIERITESSFLFSLFESYTQGRLLPNTISDGIIVPLQNVAPCLEDLEQYVKPLGKLYSITGNVGSGHISVVTLFDPLSPLYKEELQEYAKTIMTYTKKYKGGISAISGDGLSRSLFLSYMYNEATVAIFKKIKQVWDPLAILNPGKKIALDQRYLDEHLRTI